MARADAWYMFASDLHTDQMLVYAFAGTPASIDTAVEEVVERARSCPDLRLRASAHHPTFGVPEWVEGDVEPGQIVVHKADGLDWSGCLTAIGDLIEHHQVDPVEALWRLHVFVGVRGVPDSTSEPSTVCVAQISHTLGDGIRSAALAGVLFGRAGPPLATPPQRAGWSLSRGLTATRLRRKLARDTEAGLVPPPAKPVPALSTNTSPSGRSVLHTLVRNRSEVPGPSVTVGAMLAITDALCGYLEHRGEDPSHLAALVPMAYPRTPHSRNHSGPEFISLYPGTEWEERGRLINTEFDNRRRRHEHPAFAAEEAAYEALPAPLLRWVSSRPLAPTVLGNMVVSSVNRGPADLLFGGCPVFMSTGYPFLTPVIGLAHGVHGLGDKVAISVHTTESIMPDAQDYIARLEAALHP